jgi:ribosomal protein L40E
MAEQGQRQVGNCKRCGAENPLDAVRCWKCKGSFSYDLRLVQTESSQKAAPTAGMEAVSIREEVHMQWKVGDRVLANWTHDEYWYPATIQTIDGERYYIRFDDGDKEWVTSDFLMRIDIEVGDRVHSRWKGGPYYYPGRVASKNSRALR